MAQRIQEAWEAEAELFTREMDGFDGELIREPAAQKVGADSEAHRLERALQGR